MESRTRKAKLNIAVTFMGRVISMVCGLIVPGLMITSFGSEVYGATTSIAQFLAYITLLEGGIGGVARAVLYKPLAENDMATVSAVVSQIKRFFKVVAYIFVVYALVLACTFKWVSQTEALDWLTTFWLVLAISISSFGQYFIGISYSVLLQAAQKTYVTQLINSLATVLNMLAIVFLVGFGCDIVTVKLVSSMIFIMRPIIQWLYVKKRYELTSSAYDGKDLLPQRWTGLGQHIAFFLHSNTDIAVLTILADLKTVAVYSIYNVVVSQMQNFATSFSAGMEALFGDMLAKRERKQLEESFSFYETLISTVSVILFSTTAVMIVPFVRLYTENVVDVKYEAPAFAILLILSALIYCLRTPYHAVVIAAGHFSQTKWAAYGEAVINIGISMMLVRSWGLVGVALGTAIATVFRFVFYVFYLSRNIVNRNIKKFLKREIINITEFIAILIAGQYMLTIISCGDYLRWVICAIAVFAVSALITLAGNILFYPNELKKIKTKMRSKPQRCKRWD